MTIDFEIHQTAEELYVLDGLTLEAVAERLEIPKRTVELWSAEEGWVEKRKEYRRALGEIKRDTVLAKLRFLQGAMETLDPQKAYAFSSIMSATKAIEKAGGKGQSAREQRAIHTPAEAIDALQEAIERKVNGMLSNPEGLNLKALREMKDAIEMMEEMKKRYRPEWPGPQDEDVDAMTAEKLKEIIRESYGV